MGSNKTFIPRNIALKIKTGWVIGIILLCYKSLFLFASFINIKNTIDTEHWNVFFFYLIDFIFFAAIVYSIYLKSWTGATLAVFYSVAVIGNYAVIVDGFYISILDIIIILLFVQSVWGIIQYKLFLQNPEKETIIKTSIKKEKYQETQYEENDDLEDNYWMTDKQKKDLELELLNK
ncbi:MAG: hypothetical protein HRU38_17395 [Saccharospirillaceae bacterium]|nr:hypothetical protein [Pseudomonadales bacterium]NRB80414.1 hypothetical protein [Saccharospirillaceae bacterium]